jgi:hypothetical protein
MPRWMKALTVCTVLALGLPGCGSSALPRHWGSPSSASPTPSEAEEVAVRWNAARLSQALPSESHAPQGWERLEETTSVNGCDIDEGCPLVGATARAENLYGRSSTDSRFTLVAFDTEDHASAGFKSYVAIEEDRGGRTRVPLSVRADADDTLAYDDGYNTHLFLRVGGVVAHMLIFDHEGEDISAYEVQTLATWQVHRIGILADR